MGLSVNSGAYLALARIEAAGVQVALGPGNRIGLRGIARVDPALIEAVRAHKPEIIALLRLRLAEPHWLEEVGR